MQTLYSFSSIGGTISRGYMNDHDLLLEIKESKKSFDELINNRIEDEKQAEESRDIEFSSVEKVLNKRRQRINEKIDQINEFTKEVNRLLRQFGWESLIEDGEISSITEINQFTRTSQSTPELELDAYTRKTYLEFQKVKSDLGDRSGSVRKSFISSLFLWGVITFAIGFFWIVLEVNGDSFPVPESGDYSLEISKRFVFAGLISLIVVIINKNFRDKKIRSDYFNFLSSKRAALHWHEVLVEDIKIDEEKLSEIENRHKQSRLVACERYEQGLRELNERIRSDIKSAGLRGAGWVSTLWESLEPNDEHNLPLSVKLGEISLKSDFTSLKLPAFIPMTSGRNLLIKVRGSRARDDAIYAVQALLLRLLATISAGKLHFTFIDPVGLGQNVAPFMHLGDYDEKLINSRAWSEEQHIDRRLSDLTATMETVIQKYLRNQFQTIEEYNEKAAEVMEPYRFLIVIDFPTNFSEQAARRLISITQNGPRCGVYTITIVDLDKILPHGFHLEQEP